MSNPLVVTLVACARLVYDAPRLVTTVGTVWNVCGNVTCLDCSVVVTSVKVTEPQDTDYLYHKVSDVLLSHRNMPLSESVSDSE